MASAPRPIICLECGKEVDSWTKDFILNSDGYRCVVHSFPELTSMNDGRLREPECRD